MPPPRQNTSNIFMSAMINRLKKFLDAESDSDHHQNQIRVRNLKFATYLKFAISDNKINELW